MNTEEWKECPYCGQQFPEQGIADEHIIECTKDP